MHRVVFILLLATLGTPAGRIVAESKATNEGQWKEESKSKGVTIYSRVRPGSALKEFKGVGIIDAPTSAVYAVTEDRDAYPEFMPYMAEARVLKREKDRLLHYQRLELPLLSDRDYTLRVFRTKKENPEGPSYHVRWEPANEEGPAPKRGVVRVGLCDGSWLLEPEGEGKTRATYCIYTDSGGAVPKFVANHGGRIGISRLYEAVRKRVTNPKYHVNTAP